MSNLRATIAGYQRDGKYSRGGNVEDTNIFHHVGKPAIIAQKIAARCT